MGFGKLWCAWIMELLHSAKASVLVNGSPTDEFQIQRGLRKGDPLSPFLFILVMEGLHVALRKAHNASMFHGISISEIDISHLFYADDVNLMSNWDTNDLESFVS